MKLVFSNQNTFISAISNALECIDKSKHVIGDYYKSVYFTMSRQDGLITLVSTDGKVLLTQPLDVLWTDPNYTEDVRFILGGKQLEILLHCMKKIENKKSRERSSVNFELLDKTMKVSFSNFDLSMSLSTLVSRYPNYKNLLSSPSKDYTPHFYMKKDVLKFYLERQEIFVMDENDRKVFIKAKEYDELSLLKFSYNIGECEVYPFYLYAKSPSKEVWEAFEPSTNNHNLIELKRVNKVIKRSNIYKSLDAMGSNDSVITFFLLDDKIQVMNSENDNVLLISTIRRKED